MGPNVLSTVILKWEFAGLLFPSSSQTLVFLGNPLRNHKSRKFGLYGDSAAGFKDRNVEKM